MQVDAALALARSLGVDRLDAQLLLAHHLQRPRSWLIAHGDAALPAMAELAYGSDIDRRASGMPLAYLLGEREFHGLRFSVTPAVLVPRPDTETLVDWALELLRGLAGAQVLDLGTGSGAIAVSVAKRCPPARVTATDLDPAALDIARANATGHGVAVECLSGSWWTPLEGRHFDLVLSNPPYIAGDDPHLQALSHEPRAALTPGGDGLDALRAIVRGAPAHLKPGGWLLVEHGFDQGAAVRQLLDAAGLQGLQTRRDLAGLERCSGGHLPRPDLRPPP